MRLRRLTVAAVAGLGLALGLAALAGGAQKPAPRPRPILIVGGTLIDGSGAPPRRNDAILVDEGRIRSVGPQALRGAPKDARAIDAADKWILPGFVDGHVHFFQTGGLQRNLKRLVDAGAIVAAGTDAGNTRTLHGPSLHREFMLMAEAGLSPMQILVSATRHGARLMGRDKELGQIQAGMLADIVLLDADPLGDIRNTRRLFRVIRGGRIYER